MEKARVLRWLRAKRVAVLKGGWSSERSISLKTGEAVERSFRRLRVQAIGIDVKPDIPRVLKKKGIQFCFNALHGPFGEDGRIQGCLDILGIPYSGSGSIGSGIAMDKHVTKEIFLKKGVPTPPGFTVYKSDLSIDPERVIERIETFLNRSSIFIKPVDQGSAIGISRVERASEIRKALKKCLSISDGVIVEELIIGRELTVGILGDRALPVTEIISKHDYYDFYSKYSKGGSKHITPAPIVPEAAKLSKALALKAFKALGCSVYGRVDIMMQSAARQYVLEVNTIPGMTNTSLLPESAQAAGISFDDLVLEIVRLSLIERNIRA